jgi:hypothetical protein
VLRERLERVRARIQQACQRCGRDPSSVTLIGVTKGVPPALIQEAIALGVTDVGENRVQEAQAKQRILKVRSEGPIPNSEPRIPNSVKWHLIGHLQRNKAKDAVELFDLIHSVDSLALIETLERHAADQQKTIKVLIQVNVSGETTKSGCRPEELEPLAGAVRRSSHLTLTGLMTIPPLAEHPEAARPIFRQLRQLRDRLQTIVDHTGTESPRHPGTPLLLSMGMSQDFDIAIEEGADLIRVGTAIFGERS